MKIVVQQSKPPQALRLLLQAADDADGIDVALSAAGVWAGKKLTLAINGTGKDLSAFAERHRFAVLCDDAGRPTRSLTEISEAFETLDRDQIGAVVWLDTNRTYRAARCSVRHIEDIKALNPGHWDDTNEALGAVSELLTRSGVPSIFVAPPTDAKGLSEDGEEVTVGSKPQAWKDLARQVHALLKLSRRGRVLEVEIASDDWRKLGQVGEVVTITGESLGRAFAELAQGRAGEAAGTTLAEATASELAARTRRAERRRAESEGARDRLSTAAWLRMLQGPKAWAEHCEEVAGVVGSMAEEDAAHLHRANANVMQQLGWALQWMRMAEQTVEGSPYSLHASDRWEICGPSIRCCPARDDIPVAEWSDEKLREHSILAAAEDLPMWIASLAQYAGLWNEPSFAVVCKVNNLGRKGEAWEHYSESELRALVNGLLVAVATRRLCDPPKPRTRPTLVEQPREIEETPIYAGEEWEAVDDDEAIESEASVATVQDEDEQVERLEAFLGLAAAGQGVTVTRPATGAANGVPVLLPDPAAFVVLKDAAQRDILAGLLQLVGAFDDWDAFRRGTEIGNLAPRRWEADERALIYRTALAKLRSTAQREAA